MNMILGMVFAAALMVPTTVAAQGTIAGTWEGEFGATPPPPARAGRAGRGRAAAPAPAAAPAQPPEHVVLTLTQKGDAVDGSLLWPGYETSIEEGKIKGKTLQFSTFQRFQGEAIVLDFNGTVTANQIAFTVFDRSRNGPAIHFTVSRQKKQAVPPS